MELELSGFDDLQNDMTNMANALEHKASANRALAAGAVPIEEQMKRNASSDPKIISNALHGAIGTGSVKRGRNGNKRITIGVHRKDWSQEEYYPAYVEFGHGGPAPAPAHPFARPAFDTRIEDAYQEMKRILLEELFKY